ncbi:MAG: lytic transglycosylase domain-containing protein [Actinobacteria bacterium]|nr:lytic transglycosylase domain-containing protein [Actinomycetota bacterium]
MAGLVLRRALLVPLLASVALGACRDGSPSATPASNLPRLGHTQQVVYRTLVLRPEWQPDVLARLPATLHPVAQANVQAGTELRVLASSEPRPLPKWQIVPPPPAADLLAEYRSAEAATGVPWQYLAAIHLVETRMGRIRGDSSAGAQGPMQFIPSTWDIYGEGGDVNSFHDSIHAAARLLRANGAPFNLAAALRAYNDSARYVRGVTAYAEQMRADERAYLGYYHWQVYYFETWLPEGYAG